jgi:hypothetical protein
MKNLLFVFTSLLISTAVLAQPEDHPHHERHYADIEPIETEELKIEIIRPHSQVNFSQFTAKIYNKTDDYILIKKDAITFSSDEMGYGDKHPKEATMFIEPKGDITRSIKVEGGIGFKVAVIDVKLDGFSRAPAEGNAVETVEFKMKPEKNSIMVGPFAVTLKKWRFNSKEITADFKLRYRGEALGMARESRIQIRTESGTVLENTEAKDKDFIMPPMKTRTVNVVRKFEKGQVGKNESVYIIWEKALTEAESTPISVPGFTLKFDPDKTKKENK